MYMHGGGMAGVLPRVSYIHRRAVGIEHQGLGDEHRLEIYGDPRTFRQFQASCGGISDAFGSIGLLSSRHGKIVSFVSLMGCINNQLGSLGGTFLHFPELSGHNLQLLPVDSANCNSYKHSNGLKYFVPPDLFEPLFWWVLGAIICWIGVRFVHFPDLRFLAGPLFLLNGGAMVCHAVSPAIDFGLRLHGTKSVVGGESLIQQVQLSQYALGNQNLPAGIVHRMPSRRLAQSESSALRPISNL
jgi:hypothetical protein